MRVGENFGLKDHQIIRYDLKLESKAHINNATVPDFKKAYWEEVPISGKSTYEILNIFKSLLNKFTKQFIPMKKIKNTKNVKLKWVNDELKDLLEKLK